MFEFPQRGWCFAQKTSECVAACPQFLAHDSARLLRHGVVTTGEHINGGIAVSPGVNRDVGFGQERQACHALGLELVGNQIKESGASTLRSGRDGGSQEKPLSSLDWSQS